MAPLSIVALFATIRGGMRSGLGCSVIAVFYFASATYLGWASVLEWALAAPLMVWMVHTLFVRALQGKMEEGGRRREKFLSEFTDAMSHPAWITGANGEPISFNRCWREASGCSQGEAWTNSVCPEDLDKALESWSHALRTGAPTEMQFRLRAGHSAAYRRHVAHAVPVRGAEGLVAKWVVSCFDVQHVADLRIERERIEITERAAEEHRESRGFLDSLIEHMPSMVFVKHAADLRYVRLNRAGEELLGCSREQLIGLSDADFFTEKEAADFELQDRLTLDCRVATVLEEKVRSRDNGERILLTKKIPIYDSEGKPKYLMGISEDITEFKRTQEERDRFFSSSIDMLAISGMDGFFLRVNPAVQDVLGYTPEEFCAIPYEKLVHPDDLGPTREAVAKQLTHGALLNFENRYRCKNGGYKWISWKSTLVGDRMYGCGRDVTEERASRLEIEHLNRDLENRVSQRTGELRIVAERFQSVISSNMMGVMFWNGDGLITDANESFLNMLGYSSADLAQGLVRWKGLTPPEYAERDLAAREELNASGVCAAFEKEFLHKDGRRVPILMGAARFSGPAHEGVSFVLDRSDFKRAEEERVRLRLSEQAAIAASELKSSFLANMSHELRTPINGVMGMASLLLDTSLTSEQKSYGEMIRSSADSLLTLVNDILDLSKAESGKLELEVINFDIHQVLGDIDRTLAFAAGKKGLQLRQTVATALPPYFRGDPTRIGQVLMNLVSNAIKFTQRGEVSVVVDMESRSEEMINLRIEVSDTGIGIPEEAIARLFQAFTQADSSTTRRYGGTGLGLSIAKRLVALMEGSIGVKSVPGAGSTFWFTIPLGVGTHLLAESAAPETQLPQSRLRVLVAEDNSVNQLIALKMLERLGHNAVAVANGLEAVEAVRSTPYDIVFMDCQMPELDGYEATRRIRASGNAIPIVAMTANAMAGDREKCLAAGMTDYLSKPMKAKDLAHAIHRNAPKAVLKKAG
jgi:PAS domain S-box-containing protein